MSGNGAGEGIGPKLVAESIMPAVQGYRRIANELSHLTVLLNTFRFEAEGLPTAVLDYEVSFVMGTNNIQAIEMAEYDIMKGEDIDLENRSIIHLSKAGEVHDFYITIHHGMRPDAYRDMVSSYLEHAVVRMEETRKLFGEIYQRLGASGYDRRAWREALERDFVYKIYL